MVFVTHMDNTDKIYTGREFLKMNFGAYKIIYKKADKIVELPCFTKMQLRTEILKLFRKYTKYNKYVNVIGIFGEHYGESNKNKKV